jgi:erythromycin esterase
MHKLFRIIILLGGIFAFAAQAPLAQQSSSTPAVKVEAQLLEQSKPVERELKSGETHAYKVMLETGQFLNAVVNQRGIDIVVRVFAPDGSRIAEID